MSTECVVCDAETTVTDACPYCGRPCCVDHRSPESHGCPGTDAGTTTGWQTDLAAATERATGPETRLSLFRPGIGLAVATVVLVVAALAVITLVGPLVDGLEPAAVEDHIEERADEERIAAGVGPTDHDPELAAIARAHSRDMRDRGFVDHTNPDSEDPQDRVRAAGLDCQPGENIYQAPIGTLASSESALADHVVRSWLDSPGHRETLLRDRYERQGVGVAVGVEAVYVTQLFC